LPASPRRAEASTQVGRLPPRHEHLLSRERDLRSRRLRLELDAGLGKVVALLEHRERRDQIAGSDGGQPLLLLLLAPERRDRTRSHGGGEDRRREQRPARLLGEHDEVLPLKSRAAVLFGHDEAGPAELGDLFPQARVVRILRSHHGAHPFERALRVEETPNAGLELFLVCAEAEFHGQRSFH
jgi:hypothetical protein